MAVPKLDRCFLCGTWLLIEDLKPIEVPDQAGYVGKVACKRCLNKILIKGQGLPGTMRIKKII